MKRCTGVILFVLGLALTVDGPALSADAVTDANIVTGLDISDSIGPD